MLSVRSRKPGARFTAVAIVGAVSAIAAMLIASAALKGGDVSAQPTSETTISREDLAAAAGEHVFFGHQSVGMNILDGVPLVYESNGMNAPTITTTPDASRAGGYIEHAYIGENTKPLTKIEAFDAAIRGGVAERADVAFMKLCYVDIDSSTDVDVLFAQYRDTMAALERDYPDVTFLHLTAPLTTESGWKAQIKRLLGRSDATRAGNVARQQYNDLIRQEYGDTGRLFDLAALESTAPDGTRVTGTYEDATYFALAPEYAADWGHLNALGSSRAAAELLELIARATGD